MAECCPTLPSADIPECQQLAATGDAHDCTEALAEYGAGGACLPGCKTLAGCCMRAALGTTDEANCVNIATSGDEPACKVAFRMYCVQ